MKSYALFVGTADPIVPIDGIKNVMASPTEAFAHFAPEGELHSTPMAMGSTDVELIEDTNDNNLWVVTGMGHAWPGATCWWPNALGETPSDPDVTQLITTLAAGGQSGCRLDALRVPNVLGRPVVVRTPAQVTGKLPLVINLHPADITPVLSDRIVGGQHIAQTGCLVLSPSSVGPRWNVGAPDQKLTNTTDDVGWVCQLIDYAVENLNADPDRVTICGLSNGAFLANLIARDRPEKVTHVVSVCGTFYL